MAGALDLDTFVGAISGNNNFNLNRVKAKNINTSGSFYTLGAQTLSRKMTLVYNPHEV